MKDVLTQKNILLGISSNEQTRVRLLCAVQQLSDVSEMCCLSGLYLNNASYLPLDVPSEKAPKYVNGVLLLSTALDLPVFMSLLKQIEASAGGVRASGICPLDLDIVAFEGAHFDVQHRPLPRPLKYEEAYLWTCVKELCPQLQLPLPQPLVRLCLPWKRDTSWKQ